MKQPSQLLEVVVHYLLMLILIFLVLGGIRQTVGDLGFWVELVIVLVVAILYRPLVLRLGVAPASWREDNRG